MALILNPKLQCQSPNVTQKNKCVQLKCKTSNIKKPHHFHLNTFIPHIKKKPAAIVFDGCPHNDADIDPRQPVRITSHSHCPSSLADMCQLQKSCNFCTFGPAHPALINALQPSKCVNFWWQTTLLSPTVCGHPVWVVLLSNHQSKNCHHFQTWNFVPVYSLSCYVMMPSYPLQQILVPKSPPFFSPKLSHISTQAF